MGQNLTLLTYYFLYHDATIFIGILGYFFKQVISVGRKHGKKIIKNNKIVNKLEFDEFQKWKIEKEQERIRNHTLTIYGYVRANCSRTID